jgi:hypothetical protein
MLQVCFELLLKFILQCVFIVKALLTAKCIAPQLLSICITNETQKTVIYPSLL